MAIAKEISIDGIFTFNEEHKNATDSLYPRLDLAKVLLNTAVHRG